MSYSRHWDTVSTLFVVVSFDGDAAAGLMMEDDSGTDVRPGDVARLLLTTK